MANNEQDIKYFFDELSKNGYDTGSYDDFKKSMNNEEDRNWYYKELGNLGYDTGNEDEFKSMVTTTPENKKSAAPSAQNVWSMPEQEFEYVKKPDYGNTFQAPQPVAGMMDVNKTEQTPAANEVPLEQTTKSEPKNPNKVEIVENQSSLTNVPEAMRRYQASFGNDSRVGYHAEGYKVGQFSYNKNGKVYVYGMPYDDYKALPKEQRLAAFKRANGKTINELMAMGDEYDERKRSESAVNDISQSFLGNLVDSAINEETEKKKASYKPTYVQTSGGIVYDMTQKDSYVNPDDVAKNAENKIKELFKKQNVAAYINSKIPEGVPQEKFIQYLAEDMSNGIYDKMVEHEMPKSALEYIIVKAINNSIGGKIAKSAFVPLANRQLTDQAMALAEEKQSGLTNFISEVAGILVDAPAFMIAGGASELAVKAYTNPILKKLVAKGLSTEAAEKVINAALLQGKLSNKVAKLSSSANFATYEALGSIVGQYESEGKVNLGDVAKSAGKGALMGAVMGGAHTLTNRIGNNAARYGSSLAARTGVMAGFSIGEQMMQARSEGREFNIDDINWAKEFRQAALTNIAFDITDVIKTAAKGENFIAKFTHKPAFTSEDIKSLNEALGTNAKGVDEMVFEFAGKGKKGFDNLITALSDAKVPMKTKYALMSALDPEKAKDFKQTVAGLEVGDKKVILKDENGFEIETKTFRNEKDMVNYANAMRSMLFNDYITTKEYQLNEARGIAKRSYAINQMLDDGYTLEQITTALAKKAEERTKEDKLVVRTFNVLQNSAPLHNINIDGIKQNAASSVVEGENKSTVNRLNEALFKLGKEQLNETDKKLIIAYQQELDKALGEKQEINEAKRAYESMTFQERVGSIKQEAKDTPIEQQNLEEIRADLSESENALKDADEALYNSVQSMLDDGATYTQIESMLRNSVSEEKWELVKKLVSSDAVVRGFGEQIQEREIKRQNEIRSMLKPYATIGENGEEVVTDGIINGKDAYITKIEYGNAVFVYKDGSGKGMCKADEVKEMRTRAINSIVQNTAAEEIRVEKAAVSNAIKNNPKTKPVQKGLDFHQTVSNGEKSEDKQFMVIRREGDQWIVAEVGLNKDGELKPISGKPEIRMTEKEILDAQNTYYDDLERASKSTDNTTKEDKEASIPTPKDEADKLRSYDDLTDEQRINNVNVRIAKAEKELEKILKEEPKDDGDIDKYRDSMSKWKQKVEEAKKNIEFLKEVLNELKPEEAAEEPVAVEANTEEQVIEEPAVEEPVAEEPSKEEPVAEEKKANTPKEDSDFLKNESGLDEEEGAAYVENKIAEAKKALDALNKKKPKIGTDIDKYKQQKAEWEEKVKEATDAVNHWEEVKKEFTAKEEPAEEVTPVVEEPKAEEPKVEEPKMEEPKSEDVTEEPKAAEEDVVKEEPKVEEPVVERPKEEVKEEPAEQPKEETKQEETQPQAETPVEQYDYLFDKGETVSYIGKDAKVIGYKDENGKHMYEIQQGISKRFVEASRLEKLNSILAAAKKAARDAEKKAENVGAQIGSNQRKINDKEANEIIKQLKKSGVADNIIVVDSIEELNERINNQGDIIYSGEGDVAGAVLRNGDIVIVRDIMRLDTPYHEFAHKLRDAAKVLADDGDTRLLNAINKFTNGVSGDIRKFIKEKYGELNNDALLDEIFAWGLSSENGNKIESFLNERGISNSHENKTWYQNAWDSIKRIWNKVKNMFGNDYADLSVFDAYKKMSHEDLSDELHKILMDGRRIRDNRIDIVNESFNKRLEEIESGDKGSRMLDLGSTGNLLQAAGVNAGRIVLDYDKVIKKGSENYKHHHPFSPTDIKNLPKAINKPIAIFNSTNEREEKVILTSLKKDGRNFIVVLSAKLERRRGGNILNINEITTMFPKKSKGIVDWVLKNKLTYVNKKEALKWLGTSPTHQEHPTTSELLSATNLIIKFKNPKYTDGLLTKNNNIRYHILDEIEEKDEIERLESLKKDELVEVYRSMQIVEINGKRYLVPPMSGKVEGKWQEPIEIDENNNIVNKKTWVKSDERPWLAHFAVPSLTGKSKTYIPIDECKQNDNGEWMYKSLKTGDWEKVPNQQPVFYLDKTGKSKDAIWAAYNPYGHYSTDMLNDQFSSAQDRNNLVSVKFLIPKSELNKEYKAKYAKDPTGEINNWKAGIVTGQLKGTRGVILSRWGKPVKVVLNIDVANNIYDTVKDSDIIFPSNVVTKDVRKHLEDKGVRFVETDNQGNIKEGKHKGEHYSMWYDINASNENIKKWTKKTGMSWNDMEKERNAIRNEGTLFRQQEQSTGKVESRENIESSIAEESKNLGVKVKIAHSIDEVTDKQARARITEGKNVKGWFDPKTGEIVVYAPNASSSNDVKRTMLHEGVGHKGLRVLFGENFDKEMESIYQHLPESVRKSIDDSMTKNNWSHDEAIDEYMAKHAEKLNKPSWWQSVVSRVKLFAKDHFNVELTDGDVNYLLWKSKNNLKKKGDMYDMRDAAMRKVNGIGVDSEEPTNPDGGGTRFREEPINGNDYKVEENERVNVREEYNKHEQKKATRLDESLHDSQNSLKKFQELIEEKTGRKIDDWQNAYMHENRMSSTSSAEIDKIKRERVNPITETLGKLQEQGATFEQANDYLMMRHQAERNREMNVQDAITKQYDRISKSELADIEKEHHKALAKLELEHEKELKEFDKNRVDTATRYAAIKRYEDNVANENDYYAELVKSKKKELKQREARQRENWIQDKNSVYENGKSWREQEEELDKIAVDTYSADIDKDKSGIITTTGAENAKEARSAAYDEVEAFEAKHGDLAKELVQKKNELVDAVQRMEVDKSLASEEQVASLRNMYRDYVPLRGWEEDRASDVYNYIGSETRGGNQLFVAAKGRSSKADNPLANLANMAERTIGQGNRNLLKNTLANLVQANPNDLITMSESYEQKKVVDGDEVWEEIFPEIPEGATSKQVADILSKFYADCEEESKKSNPVIRKAKNTFKTDLKTTKDEKAQHAIHFKRNGKDYTMYVNGDPRIAQAVNGQLTMGVDGKAWSFLTAQKNFMSKVQTSLNPDFIVSNFQRDAIYASTMAYMKEGKEYGNKFLKNLGILTGSTVVGGKIKAGKINESNLYGMIKKYNEGTLDMNNNTHKYFKEFVENGGETGWAFTDDVKESKRKLKDEINHLDNSTAKKAAVHKAQDALNSVLDKIEMLNRCSEDASRFSAYLTSREAGRSIAKSIYDAKEISVNFNRRGAGLNSEKDSDNLMMKAAFNAIQIFKSSTSYFNAGVQGTSNFLGVMSKDKKKAASLISFGILAGAANAIIADLILDDDKKKRLPEYTRYGNLYLPMGNVSLVASLPIEARPFFGLGNMMYDYARGNKKYVKGKTATKEIVGLFSQLSPVDFMSGGTPITAANPILDVLTNKSWTGTPIYKDNQHNKFMPEFTKAYVSTSPTLVEATKMLNEISGGDDVTSGLIDLNPAKIEYLFKGYFGGIYSTANNIADIIFDGISSIEEGTNNMKVRNVPVVNRFIKSGDKHAEERSVVSEYYNNKDYFDEFHSRMNGYKKILESKDSSAKDRDYASKQIKKMNSSDDLVKYTVFHKYENMINKKGISDDAKNKLMQKCNELLRK